MEINSKEDIVRPRTEKDPFGRGARAFKTTLREYLKTLEEQ